jgi:hypothetical protein
VSVPCNPTDITRRLIALRHKGKSWQFCSEELGVSVEELRELSIELRDAGQWKLNGQPARGASTVGESSRPPGRPRVDSVSINVRLAVDVAAALREVATANHVREGIVISEALVRTQKLDFKGRRVHLGPPRKNMNVRISTDIFNQYKQQHETEPVGTLVAAACEKLLRDLGCKMVTP